MRFVMQHVGTLRRDVQMTVYCFFAQLIVLHNLHGKPAWETKPSKLFKEVQPNREENSSSCPASRHRGQGRGAQISMGEIWEMSLGRYY